MGERKPHLGLVPCPSDGCTTRVTTRHNGGTTGSTTLKRRYKVIEAAKVLGVGTDAVRKRVARGTVEHERVDDTVCVWLDDGHDNGTTWRRDGGANGDGAELLDAYKEQVGYLRSQLAQERRANDENRRLLAALIQRVPELEGGVDPPASSEAHEDVAQWPANGAGGPAPTAGSTEAQDGPGRVSWCRRVFGG